jgi:ferredoxin
VFSISSNWIVRFDDVVTRQLHEATGRKASIMCREVIQGEKRILKTGLGLKAAMKIVMPAFGLALRLAGKDLAVNKACSQCGLCVRNCPAGNIYEKNGRIRFRFSCSCCMRCIYSCPKDALNFRFLSFFSVPGGYDIKKILNNRCDGNGTLEKQVPPFFKAYIQDDSM